MTLPASSSSSSSMPVPSTADDPANPLKQLGLPSPLILGSASFTRKLILTEMGIPFDLAVVPIDERSMGDRSGDPSELVTFLANAKADALVQALTSLESSSSSSVSESVATVASSLSSSFPQGRLILTADQVVTSSSSSSQTTTTTTTILEKPTSVEEARSFVSSYAIAPPQTVGAVTLTHLPSGIRLCGVHIATVRFKPSVAEGDLVGRLLDEGAPVLACAGGLMVEHPFVREHVVGIEGGEDSVMGLSKELVLRLLKEMKGELERIADDNA